MRGVGWRPRRSCSASSARCAVHDAMQLLDGHAAAGWVCGPAQPAAHGARGTTQHHAAGRALGSQLHAQLGRRREPRRWLSGGGRRARRAPPQLRPYPLPAPTSLEPGLFRASDRRWCLAPSPRRWTSCGRRIARSACPAPRSSSNAYRRTQTTLPTLAPRVALRRRRGRRAKWARGRGEPPPAPAPARCRCRTWRSSSSSSSSRTVACR